MKKVFFVSAFLIFLLLCSYIYPVPTDVEKLSGVDYFPTIDKAFNATKKSIFVVMYYIEYKKDEHDSKVTILLNNLVKAKERGVNVSVILDRTAVFTKDVVKGKRMSIDGKNMPAFYFLKRYGIDVKFDSVDIYTHGKCVVIDGETVILGSHNWTKNSLTRSNEYSVLIKSKELAKGLLADFSEIQIDYEASNREAEEYAELSEGILLNILNGFVSTSNDYCWDVYMYLIGHFVPDIETEFDYKAVAEYLGITERDTEKGYREMLAETLKQLYEKYGLLEYTPVWNKNALVKLKAQEGNKIEIPKKFWYYGWDRRLGLSAQFCYFVNLIEGRQSHREWTISKKKLIKKYRIGKDAISRGMAELRHWNIVQIVYGIVATGQDYGTRQANRYRLKDLYKIEDFESELQKLYDKYGKGRVERVRELAKIVFCENNLAEIEEIIRLMDEYSKDEVLAAFNKIAPWDEANPKRSMAYVKGILRRGVMDEE